MKKFNFNIRGKFIGFCFNPIKINLYLYLLHFALYY